MVDDDFQSLLQVIKRIMIERYKGLNMITPYPTIEFRIPNGEIEFTELNYNIRLFLKLYRPDYEFLDDEYRGYKEKYKWKYLGDGLPNNVDRVFEQTVGAMITSYCKHPLLSKSQLEAHCQFILDKYNLEYEDQKTFEGCVGKNKLRMII